MIDYFILHDRGPLEPDRWYLGGPVDSSGRVVDPRLFTRCRKAAVPSPLHVPVRQTGPQRDFTLGDFDMPVLIDEIAQQLVALAPQDVQCIPAFVDGREEPYSIVNVVSEKDALDSEASDISYWGKSVLPQFEGKILAVGKLALRGDRLDGAHCLRVTTWHPPIIVSADAMVVLARASGAAFDPVVIT